MGKYRVGSGSRVIWSESEFKNTRNGDGMNEQRERKARKSGGVVGMISEMIATLHVASQSSRDAREVQSFAKNLEVFVRGAGKMLDVREMRGQVGDRTPEKVGA